MSNSSTEAVPRTDFSVSWLAQLATFPVLVYAWMSLSLFTPLYQLCLKLLPPKASGGNKSAITFPRNLDSWNQDTNAAVQSAEPYQENPAIAEPSRTPPTSTMPSLRVDDLDGTGLAVNRYVGYAVPFPYDGDRNIIPVVVSSMVVAPPVPATVLGAPPNVRCWPFPRT